MTCKMSLPQSMHDRPSTVQQPPGRCDWGPKIGQDELGPAVSDRRANLHNAWRDETIRGWLGLLLASHALLFDLCLQCRRLILMRKIKPMFPTVIASLNVHALMAPPRISIGAHRVGVFFCLLCALWLPCIRMLALHQPCVP